MITYTATPDAVGDSLALSALVGSLPLLTFFAMLLIAKASAYVAGLASLVVSLVIAVVAFGMPTHLALLSATQGAVYGLVPIVWIVVMALWFYRVTVISGRFNDLRSIFDAIGGGDIRIQAMLIAFCFGGLLEALAGFGAPVAITATMVLALGLKPLKTAVVCLIANTAPVAFGDGRGVRCVSIESTARIMSSTWASVVVAVRAMPVPDACVPVVEPVSIRK